MTATLIWGSGRELWTPPTLTIHSLTISNKLYKASASRDMFELCVVNGRINTLEFGGGRIEMGATWIHGIGGSPVHKIAEETHSLESEEPWECMDGSDNDVPTSVAKGRFKVKPSIVDSITDLFNNLMDYAHNNSKLPENNNSKLVSGSQKSLSSFLRQGLKAYWGSMKERDDELKGYGSLRNASLSGEGERKREGEDEI